MKYDINTPQPKWKQNKFKAMHKEREQLLGKSKEEIIEMYLSCKYSVKGMTKGFTMPIFREAVTFKKKGSDARKRSQQETKEVGAQRFGKLLAGKGIVITDKLTAGKALTLLREKKVIEKDLPDPKTVRGYIKLLLATTSKVSKIKKVL